MINSLSTESQNVAIIMMALTLSEDHPKAQEISSFSERLERFLTAYKAILIVHGDDRSNFDVKEVMQKAPTK